MSFLFIVASSTNDFFTTSGIWPCLEFGTMGDVFLNSGTEKGVSSQSGPLENTDQDDLDMQRLGNKQEFKVGSVESMSVWSGHCGGVCARGVFVTPD